MKGILVDWYPTGKREGGIDRQKDKNLYCHWQNPDVFPSKEIYIILDGNADPYRGRQGVTVLEDDAAIDQAIDDFFPERIQVYSEVMLIKALEEVGKKLGDFPTYDDMINFALDNKLLGVSRLERFKMAQVRLMH